MKIVKYVDVTLQSAIIVSVLFYLFVNPGGALFLFLIGMGCIQTVSAAIHIPYFIANKNKLRKMYYWGLLITALSWASVAILNTVFPSPFWQTVTIACVASTSTVLGIFYYIVSINELKTMLHIRKQQNLVDIGH